MNKGLEALEKVKIRCLDYDVDIKPTLFCEKELKIIEKELKDKEKQDKVLHSITLFEYNGNYGIQFFNGKVMLPCSKEVHDLVKEVLKDSK